MAQRFIGYRVYILLYAFRVRLSLIKKYENCIFKMVAYQTMFDVVDVIALKDWHLIIFSIWCFHFFPGPRIVFTSIQCSVCCCCCVCTRACARVCTFHFGLISNQT